MIASGSVSSSPIVKVTWLNQRFDEAFLSSIFTKKGPENEKKKEAIKEKARRKEKKKERNKYKTTCREDDDERDDKNKEEQPKDKT